LTGALLAFSRPLISQTETRILCSSALSPLTGHAFLERRYLIIPGLRSSRIYIVDTKPDPTQAKIHKIIEPEKASRRAPIFDPGI
jgi:56kDa selenium binding protein (SBP56)